MTELAEIRIRDPFVLTVPEERCYYLFGSTDPNTWGGAGTGFDCYRSTDLQAWDGPVPAFRAPVGFWGWGQFWAPEVHRYDDRFFMFATFAADRGLGHEEAALRRGTAVLVADRPQGPYEPWSDGPVTPPHWVCLDGTLHVDDRGDPWLVFCHEWTQIGDGAVLAQRLQRDLRAAAGDPVVLFTASSAPWTRPLAAGDPGAARVPGESWVTDGPSLHRTASGGLEMVWSSFAAGGYAAGTATSSTGSVLGPWTHRPAPLWDVDGGHAMVSRDLDGHLRLVLHQPNDLGAERARLIDLAEGPTGLRLAHEPVARVPGARTGPPL